MFHLYARELQKEKWDHPQIHITFPKETWQNKSALYNLKVYHLKPYQILVLQNAELLSVIC